MKKLRLRTNKDIFEDFKKFKFYIILAFRKE